MKFGLIIRGQYPQGDDMQLRLREDLEAAKLAEELGYDCVAKGSHYSSHPFQYIQQIPYLCQVALVAPNLRLIPGVVLLPLHSPLHVAEELASLDVMCGGKLVFGAGIGYREVEFRAFGTTLKQAGRRFEECLTAVKRLWTEDFVTMKASYFELDGANCTVLPMQKPMPPVWIGANIDVGIRRAARMADAWFVNPHNKLDTIARQMEVYKRELDVCGKPFPAELPMAREVFIARSRAEAIERAKPSLEVKYKAYRDWGQDKVMPSSDHFDLDFDDLVNDRFLIGSPAEVTRADYRSPPAVRCHHADRRRALGRHAEEPGDRADAVAGRGGVPGSSLGWLMSSPSPFGATLITLSTAMPSGGHGLPLVECGERCTEPVGHCGVDGVRRTEVEIRSAKHGGSDVRRGSTRSAVRASQASNALNIEASSGVSCRMLVRRRTAEANSAAAKSLTTRMSGLLDM